MFHRVALQPDHSSTRSQGYPPETLRHIGVQVAAVLSRHSSLQMYKRSIERQFALMAAQLHEEEVELLPHRVFLLVEMRGSGGMSTPLAQIASILGEVGYWKPPTHVQHYHRQDVYYLGKSTQKLFDDYAVLDKRVKQLHTQLGYIKQDRHMKPETTPHEVLEGLAMAADRAKVQAEVDAVVGLLEQTNQRGWFRWLFVASHPFTSKIKFKRITTFS